jgi:hypothetical protein
MAAMMMLGRAPPWCLGLLITITRIVRYQRPTPMPNINNQRGDPGPQIPMLQPMR